MTSDKYHIIKEVGKGGMATVFEAVDKASGRKVAVKILNSKFSNDKDISLRFENEATATMMINHPNIAGAYDFTEIDGNPVIVMELVKGISLTDLVTKNGAIPKEQAIKYMMQILSAIDFVHKKGIIHRDLKPSNILISENNQIKIIDFGIAKFHNGIAIEETVPGTVIGTYMYMSPQQVKGKKLDNLTDIYSLGAVFYYMLSGQHPYHDVVGEFNVQSCVVDKPIPPVKYPDLNSIIQKATQKKPKDRFMSCDEFARSIAYGFNKVPIETTAPVAHKDDIVLTIGRSNSNNIVLPIQEISRKHAQLSINISKKKYTIIDLNSTSGSYVNGKKINGAYRLNQGDKVVLANADFSWEKYVLKILQDATLIGNNNEGNSFITGNEYQKENLAQTFSSYSNQINTNDYVPLSLFDYYKKTMSKYLKFDGRASAKEFWSYITFIFLFYLLVFALYIILTNTMKFTSFSKYTIIRFTIILSSLFFLIHFIPLISVSARRMNDANSSE